MPMAVGDQAEFIDEEGEQIIIVIIDGITASETGNAGFAYMIHDRFGNEWIVDPSELEQVVTEE